MLPAQRSEGNSFTSLSFVVKLEQFIEAGIFVNT